MLLKDTDELPRGWVGTPLSEAIDKIVGGGTPSKAVPSYYEGEIPWMTVKDMNKFRLKDTVDHISQEGVDNSSTNVIPAGTPIVATRMSLGKIVRASFDSAINQDLKAIFLNKEINDYYFEYWYRSMAPIIESMGTGTTVKGIKLTQLHALDFVLPPLAEQKRIVEKLDSLLAQVETIQQRLNNLPNIIKRFRQSVLAAAVSGKLTEQWRGDNIYPSVDVIKVSEKFQNKIKPGKKYKFVEQSEEYAFEIPKSWSLTAIGNLSVYQQGMQIAKSTRREELEDNTLPILRTVNYVNKFLKDVHYAIVDSKAIIAESEDIIISRTGTVGRVLTGFKGIMHNNSFRIIFPKTDVLREYLILFLESPVCQNYVRENSGRSSQPDLTHTAFSKCPFSIPVMEEQTEIVRLVEQHFALADTLEKNLKNAKQRVDNLTQSILAKAFRGELVPQDPNDEPAEQLLARIKTARVEAELLEKAAKKVTSKTKRQKGVVS
jgi:type I restriction enzyme S subunit